MGTEPGNGNISAVESCAGLKVADDLHLLQIFVKKFAYNRGMCTARVQVMRDCKCLRTGVACKVVGIQHDAGKHHICLFLLQHGVPWALFQHLRHDFTG